jgi:hypothetical protein
MLRPIRRQLFAVLFAASPLWIDAAAGQERTPEMDSPASTHWSFQPVVRPAVPAAKNTAWVRNPIDHFVLAKLERLGIAPSPEADRPTLIRRLSLDLLGLPPTPAEVDDFVRDSSPGAYERLVARLLDSPHFGERWGRHWLDLARYADSDGYEKDSPRPYAYLYRNWVIDALNRNVPFDQFTVEQLAGDLLPDSTLEMKTATGFHRNTLTNREGGVDQEEFRAKANVDRVSTTGTVWLGLTLACAECHNHKYDPLTQKDFYGMFSFFNASMEVETPAPQPEEVAAYEQARSAYQAEHAKRSTALEQFEKEQLPGRLEVWEAANVGKISTVRWVTLDPMSANSASGATLTQQPDGSIQLAGKGPLEDTYTLELQTNLTGITAIRLEVLPDPNHPAMGPGRTNHGNFVLNEFSAKLVRDGDARPVVLQNARADFSQDKYPIAGAIDGNPGTGWAVAPRLGQRHVAVFETKETLHGSSSETDGGSPMTLLITLDQRYGTQHTIGRFRISATTEPRPVPAEEISEDAMVAMRTPRDQRTEKQATALMSYYRSIDSEWMKLNSAVTEHAKRAPPPPTTKAMTIGQNPRPPATHVHIRGDFLRRGDAVEPIPPAILTGLLPFESAAQPNRIDLAKWIVNPGNPLTARVAINRMWQYLFGKGLVGTPNDFGTRGDAPTHPELLDWLASEWMHPTGNGQSGAARRGWQQKEMIKLIVASATYRQSSSTRPELVQTDPTNTLLARQNRYRLEAEIVRDLHLAVSGLLSPTIGGPSVRPPQPTGVSDLTYAGSAKWIESKGQDRYRRGLYTWFQRTSPYPMLTTFDSPDGVVCTVRRERSNTPLQALTLLNDVVFVECAQGLARRALTQGGRGTETHRSAALNGKLAASPTTLAPGCGWLLNGKLAASPTIARAMFWLCMSRDPEAAELARLVQLKDELTAACRANPEFSARLSGDVSIDGIDSVELASWVAVARTLMNLDEFVTRE